MPVQRGDAGDAEGCGYRGGMPVRPRDAGSAEGCPHGGGMPVARGDAGAAGPVPALVTQVVQDGQVMANGSDPLLLPGAPRPPGLANRSLGVHLGGASLLPPGGCRGGRAGSSGPARGAEGPPAARAGLLDARVELPLLGLAVGAALALGALLGLGSCAAGLACRQAELSKGQAGAGGPLPQGSPCSGCGHPQAPGGRLPRQARSLPPDLRLGDLAQDTGGSAKDAGAGARGEDGALPALENSLLLSQLGFIQLPTSGRIYRVPSASSDEIWL
ncbi:LOW QUALITY PROTEIN: transmembrane protein 25 [Rhynochetos jubatus]